MSGAALAMLVLLGMGLAGTYLDIDGAGWCVAVGLFGLVFGDVYP